MNLDDIKQRVAAATPGPWRIGMPNMYCKLHKSGYHPGANKGCVYTLNGWLDGGRYIYSDDQPLGSTVEPTMIAGTYDYDAGGVVNKADAKFIAHARTDIPALLEEIERLRAALRVLADDAYDREDRALARDALSRDYSAEISRPGVSGGQPPE